MPDESPIWYANLPSWSKVFFQLGFASLVAVLFYLDSRDRSSQLREFQNEARVQAREDRQFFREESQANRNELKNLREDLQVVTKVMQQSIDKLNENHQKLKIEVNNLKPGTVPYPRDKE